MAYFSGKTGKLLREHLKVKDGRITLPLDITNMILKNSKIVAHIRKILLIKQSGRCKICGELQSEQKLNFHVDHNHETGEIRGVLCNNCNTGIGFLQDDPEILRKATEYLKG